MAVVPDPRIPDRPFILCGTSSSVFRNVGEQLPMAISRELAAQSLVLGLVHTPVDSVYSVLPYVRAFTFAWQADKASNANNKDNSSQSLSLDSIPTV
jgi:hypothetical protein